MTQPPDAQKNFLVVDAKTENSAIEAAFDRFTSERKDIAILLINQHVRATSSDYQELLYSLGAFQCREEGTKRRPALTSPQIAEKIRHRVETYTAAFPSLLEIPSKDHPYDPDKDSVLKRVRRLFGE